MLDAFNYSVTEQTLDTKAWLSLTTTKQSNDLELSEIMDDFLFSKRQRITLRLLYAMSRPSVVCLSVCLSVTLVHPTQAVKLLGNFFSPYDSSGTLVF